MARTERFETVGGQKWHVIEDDDVTQANSPIPNMQFIYQGARGPGKSTEVQMRYEISSAIPLPKRRKSRKGNSHPPAVQSAYEAYSGAFKAIYGVRPVGFTYDKASGFIRIGNAPGVSLMRLKELTRMLKARV